MSVRWNPWHGCHKISEGCLHCYVYRTDAKYGKDSGEIKKTTSFYLPVNRRRDKAYKVPPGEEVFTCFTSDLLLEEADEWRGEIWEMMHTRSDLHFLFITKRIHRLAQCLPDDWGEGYPNVHICCTVENQHRADFRLPIFRDAPIRTKSIICEPLLEPIDLSPYLGPWVSQVQVGGESGPEARVCDYNWILDIHRQCVEADVPFLFRQTGARLRKNGKIYIIPRNHQHQQARKAGINYKENRLER